MKCRKRRPPLFETSGHLYAREAKTVYVNVVNRHKENSISADIFSNSGPFAGNAETTLLTAASLEEPFSYDKREQYLPVGKTVKTEGNKISVSFPAHSFTQIKITVKP